MTLAIDTYAGFRAMADTGEWLDLAWTTDERECLSSNILELLRDGLAREVAQGLTWTRRYMVDDPYGGIALGTAVAGHFSAPRVADHVSCAAGVNALLHALAHAWPANGVLIGSDCYPDFPHWSQRAGRRLQAMPAHAAPDDWVRASQAAGARVWFFERPSFTGARWDSLAAVEAFTLAAAQVGALVLIDESNANYCAPEDSAVAQTAQADKLVVLRGLSKAYGLGSLRIGFATSSPSLTSSVREALAPLQVNSLSVQLARTVLEAGDVGAPLLSARIGVLPSAREMPYLLPTDPAPLHRRAVRTKPHPLWTQPAVLRQVHRMSVPLQEERLRQFEDRLLHLP
jgi:histidinol-phosphate/aromatic aminotransferase/cobyric acid decarboxylase-like protein